MLSEIATSVRTASSAADETVSVIIPAYNSERFVRQLLENIAAQYDRGRFEIIVVDSGSTDETRKEVERFSLEHEEIDVRLLSNPSKSIPASLNLGIREARGEVIVRMDAHSVPSANYVRRCVELLRNKEAAIVGMPIRVRPGAETRIGEAIALAVGHPFGIGDARYRMADQTSQFVDTVPFGAFPKKLWQDVGGFNESLLTNEDYDFYYRVRQAGGRILLDTSAHSDYFARGSLRALIKQYARYGRWKAQMIKLHPRSLRLRQVAAPLFVLALVLMPLVGLWLRFDLWLWLLMLAAYGALSLIFAFRLAWKKRRLSLVPAISLAFFLIHISWGSSFLVGLFRRPRG